MWHGESAINFLADIFLFLTGLWDRRMQFKKEKKESLYV